MPRVTKLILGLFLTALLTGCSAYVDDYQFEPRPAVAEIPATQPSQPPVISLLASVIGVHREDAREEIPASVELRLRLRNNGPEAVLFDPHSLELTNGQFGRFPPPMLQPPQSWNLSPGQDALLAAYFPFPPGRSWDNTDLESLQLRVLSKIGGRTVEQVVYFRRVIPVYLSRYYDYPPYGFYGGAVFIHRHRR